jgi:hypothetical protein
MSVLAQLKSRLYEKQAESRSPRPTRVTPTAAAGSLSRQSDAGGITLPHASLALMNLIAPDSPGTRFRSASRSPELQDISPKSNSDPFMDLLFSGWNPDLPDPATLNH